MASGGAPSKKSALSTLLRGGKKVLPVLGAFVAPEFAPVVQALMHRIGPGASSSEQVVEELEHRVSDQLRHTAAVQDQHQEEIRRGLREQALVSAQLQAELHSMRGLLERSVADREGMRDSIRELESRLKYLTVAAVAAVVLGSLALTFALLRHT